MRTVVLNLSRYAVCFAGFGIVSAAVFAADVDYNREIRPILAKNCFACHGPDEEHRESGLRLDVRTAALAKADSGEAAIVPGKPQASELIVRVSADDEYTVMPPSDSGHSLTPAQIDLLRRWIKQGAPYAEHWSFTPPKAWPLPKVQQTDWPSGGVDYFVLARLEAARLRPSPAADRYELLRRLSFDLRGLPPSLAEIQAFVEDDSPDAYEKAVDRLLADPAFGERWAQMWLDQARYADSAGYASDPLRTIWRYRDWVIDAFNHNLPYDRFTIEQIAGDLLPEATLEQKIATAFHRNTMTNTEGGTDDEEFRVAAVKDRIETTLQVWMGLTMKCANCHNHKYDPLSQEEYYRLFAVFNQTADTDLPNESPVMELSTPEYQQKLSEWQARLKVLQQKVDLEAAQQAEPDKKAEADQEDDLLDLNPSYGGFEPEETESKDKPQESSELAALRKQLDAHKKRRPKAPSVPVMQELSADKRRSTHLMIKGNFLDPGDEVKPGLPASFHTVPQQTAIDRLAVARWLIDGDNPLTARVAVNRFWSQIFGTGLVETEEDFGTQGDPPSHPQLLDWLAVQFMQDGWDVKALLKRIVMSQTYRQTARVSPELLVADPRNRLLSRGPRFRLKAEMVRDQALAASGLLSRKIKGPSVYPPQPAGLWRAAFNGRDRKWPTSEGADRYRRGLYTFWRRTVPYPSMATFDAPSREICSIRRIRTNTPLQALVTLNDPVYVEMAQALGRRIIAEGGTSSRERAEFGLFTALCRPPSATQIEAIEALFDDEQSHYAKNSEAAMVLATDPLGPLPENVDAADAAAWTVVANVLLNLDAVLTK